MQLSEILKRARAAGACKNALRAIEKCGTMAKVKRHPRAAEWACWYAINVIHDRWPEGEEAIKKDAYWLRYYTWFVG